MKTLLVNWQRVQLCWCIAQNLNWWHSVILCFALVERGVCINSKWLLARQCLLSCHSMCSRSWQLPHCDIGHIVSTQTHQWFWDQKSRWSYHHRESLLFQYHTGCCRQRHHPENRCAYLALPSPAGIKHGWHVGVGLDPSLTALLRYHRPILWGVCNGAFQECCVEIFLHRRSKWTAFLIASRGIGRHWMDCLEWQKTMWPFWQKVWAWHWNHTQLECGNNRNQLIAAASSCWRTFQLVFLPPNLWPEKSHGWWIGTICFLFESEKSFFFGWGNAPSWPCAYFFRCVVRFNHAPKTPASLCSALHCAEITFFRCKRPFTFPPVWHRYWRYALRKLGFNYPGGLGGWNLLPMLLCGGLFHKPWHKDHIFKQPVFFKK